MTDLYHKRGYITGVNVDKRRIKLSDWLDRYEVLDYSLELEPELIGAMRRREFATLTVARGLIVRLWRWVGLADDGTTVRGRIAEVNVVERRAKIMALASGGYDLGYDADLEAQIIDAMRTGLGVAVAVEHGRVVALETCL